MSKTPNEKESEILRLLERGWSYREISRVLNIGIATISRIVKRSDSNESKSLTKEKSLILREIEINRQLLDGLENKLNQLTETKS